jgi:hypothetical protein
MVFINSIMKANPGLTAFENDRNCAERNLPLRKSPVMKAIRNPVHPITDALVA